MDAVYRAESRRVLATLIRLRGGSNSQRRRCTTRQSRDLPPNCAFAFTASNASAGSGLSSQDEL